MTFAVAPSWCGLVALLVAVGCGGEDQSTIQPLLESPGAAGSSGTAGAPAAPDPAAPGPAEPPPAEPPSEPETPLYVVSTGAVSGENFLGYLTTVTSLEPGTTFDLENAVELSAGAWVFSREGEAAVYAASLAEPTIVRWEVRGEHDFVRRETLSFAGLGMQTAYLAASAPIFSAQKSYFVDEDQDRIIIWNPQAMELIGSIELGDEAIGPLLPIAEGALLIHGDELLVTVGWRDADDTSAYGDHVRLVTIDTNTDQIVDSSTETRNVHAALNTRASDGTAYFSPYSLYAAYREIGAGHGAPSVVMRIDPTSGGFDPAYQLDMSALVGGRPAGDFTLLDDDTALIRAWHPELVDPVDPGDWQAVLWNEAGFLWWRWNVGDASAVLIEGQEPGALGASVFPIDGKTYSTRYATDYSSTTLLEITPAGAFVPVLEGPGQIIGPGVLRVR